MRSIQLLLAAGLCAVSMSVVASTPDLPSCDVYQLACHWTDSSREASYDINRVVIHKGEGATASGGASWFANCSSGGSAHYFFDKSNGQCYQCVLEQDIAWHAGNGSTNQNSVGIEHSGWTANNDTSTACYNESAIETKSCVTYYGVPGNRSYIIGHSQVPGCPNPGGGGTSCHTDPGFLWNWTYYMAQVTGGGGGAVDMIVDNSSGLFSASANWATGSSAGDKYGADYRYRSTAAISDQAGWLFGPPETGTYQISAWWTAGTNRSANVSYKLPDNSTVAVNQRVNGGKWNLLGSKSLTGGGLAGVNLSCWAATGYVAVADAIRMTK